MAQDLDSLVLGEHARDLGVHPGNRSELPRPVGLVMRPGDPGGSMPLPLSGHPEPGRTVHREPRTRTPNSELRTPNSEPRTPNPEPNVNTNLEARTRNGERFMFRGTASE